MRRQMTVLVLTLLMAGIGAADTKIVMQDHTDAFSMMGQKQPARDSESVIWVGDGRLRVEQGDTLFIVRSDEKKMYIVDSGAKTFSAIPLPIDTSDLLPPEVAKQMQAMMSFEAKVTPTEETETINGWTARKYKVEITSPMMEVQQTVWATTELGLEPDALNAMFEHVQMLKPGMEKVIAELRKIEGVQVRTDSSTTMMGTTFSGRSQVVSVEQTEAPAAAYQPPAGFKEKKFDLMGMMQQQQQ